jgi:hypothetical protein
MATHASPYLLTLGRRKHLFIGDGRMRSALALEGIYSSDPETHLAHGEPISGPPLRVHRTRYRHFPVHLDPTGEPGHAHGRVHPRACRVVSRILARSLWRTRSSWRCGHRLLRLILLWSLLLLLLLLIRRVELRLR